MICSIGIHLTSVWMWFKFDDKSKRNFNRYSIHWYYMFITSLGLFGGYNGTASHHSTITFYGLCYDFYCIFFIEFLLLCDVEISEWIFVSSKNWPLILSIIIIYLIFSITASPAQHRQFMRMLVNFITQEIVIGLWWVHQ